MVKTLSLNSNFTVVIEASSCNSQNNYRLKLYAAMYKRVG